jgi:hypothetical protein
MIDYEAIEAEVVCEDDSSETSLLYSNTITSDSDVQHGTFYLPSLSERSSFPA